MSWSRLVSIVTGVGAMVAGVLLPTTAPVLMPVGMALLGWSTPHPADRKP
jgi:hypothetical protein